MRATLTWRNLAIVFMLMAFSIVAAACPLEDIDQLQRDVEKNQSAIEANQSAIEDIQAELRMLSGNDMTIREELEDIRMELEGLSGEVESINRNVIISRTGIAALIVVGCIFALALSVLVIVFSAWFVNNKLLKPAN